MCGVSGSIPGFAEDFRFPSLHGDVCHSLKKRCPDFWSYGTQRHGTLNGRYGLTTHTDAIFPDFSGIPDFHKSKLSKKTPIISIKNWKDLASYFCFNNEDAVSALS